MLNDEPEAGSIEELNQMRAVREVKRLKNGELAVAVEADRTFADPRMQTPGTQAIFPEEVADWMRESRYEQQKLAFQVGGEYEGCFSIRLAVNGSRHTVTWNVSPAQARLQAKISLGGFTTKTGPIPRKQAHKLERILHHAPGCSVELVGFWGDEGDGEAE